MLWANGSFFRGENASDYVMELYVCMYVYVCMCVCIMSNERIQGRGDTSGLDGQPVQEHGNVV